MQGCHLWAHPGITTWQGLQQAAQRVLSPEQQLLRTFLLYKEDIQAGLRRAHCRQNVY